MEKETNIKGYIENFKDGFIRGWASITDLDQSNTCDLFINGKFISRVDATIYREDLKDAGIRSGVAGFLAPIPWFFCDNQNHEVLLVRSNSDQIIHSKSLKFTRNKYLTPLEENVVFDHVSKPYEKHKKVLFLAGFTNQPKLLNYQKHFIQAFQKAGFYVIYTVASDTPEVLSEVLSDADRVVIRRNCGYDFGSWATAFQLCQREFLAATDVVWANDSIIGPVNSIDTLLEKINNSSSDIWAITDSQDRKYHFQSYFWGLKKTEGQFVPTIDAFFFYRHGLPQDKDEAINYYEIEALNFFKRHGLSVDILFPEHALISVAEARFIAELKVYSQKWKPLFDLPLRKGETHAFKEGVLNLATVLINRRATNPSHMYWNALVESGFPFVKRELMTLNPTNYPFPYQFRAVFEEHKATELLDDLSEAFKFGRII